MSFNEIGIDNAYRILAPRPTVIVTTINKKGDVNAAPFSFTMPVSMNPPLISFASVPSHHTYKNIMETNEFVINIPGADILENMWITGEKFPEEVNEIEKANLTQEDSLKVSPPKIGECMAAIECRVHWIKKAGDHDIIIGEVLHLGIKEDILKEGILNVKKVKPVLHLGGVNFVIGDNLKKVGE